MTRNLNFDLIAFQSVDWSRNSCSSLIALLAGLSLSCPIPAAASEFLGVYPYNQVTSPAESGPDSFQPSLAGEIISASHRANNTVLIKNYTIAEALPYRRIFGTVSVHGVDDETFSDDVIDHTWNFNRTKNPAAPALKLPQYELGWGGECRITIDWQLEAVDASNIQVSGIINFYEGTSESTNDLADSKSFSFVVPKGRSTNHVVQLLNSEPGGGDTATITFNLTNSVVETLGR